MQPTSMPTIANTCFLIYDILTQTELFGPCDKDIFSKKENNLLQNKNPHNVIYGDLYIILSVKH